jgi:hypothetical protein
MRGSPSTTQHSLTGGRYALPGPGLHRLVHASLLGARTAYLSQKFWGDRNPVPLFLVRSIVEPTVRLTVAWLGRF